MPALRNPYNMPLSHMRLKQQPLPALSGGQSPGGALRGQRTASERGFSSMGEGDSFLDGDTSRTSDRGAPKISFSGTSGDTSGDTSINPDEDITAKEEIQRLQSYIVALQRQKTQKQQKAIAALKTGLKRFVGSSWNSHPESMKRKDINLMLEGASNSAIPGTYELFTPDEEFPVEDIEKVRQRIIDVMRDKDYTFKEKIEIIQKIMAETSESGGNIINEQIDQRAAEMMKQDNVPIGNTGDVDIDWNSLEDERAYREKALDEITARQILQEAGGDKERARAIARQKGFSF